MSEAEKRGIIEVSSLGQFLLHLRIPIDTAFEAIQKSSDVNSLCDHPLLRVYLNDLQKKSLLENSWVMNYELQSLSDAIKSHYSANSGLTK